MSQSIGVVLFGKYTCEGVAFTKDIHFQKVFIQQVLFVLNLFSHLPHILVTRAFPHFQPIAVSRGHC